MLDVYLSGRVSCGILRPECAQRRGDMDWQDIPSDTVKEFIRPICQILDMAFNGVKAIWEKPGIERRARAECTKRKLEAENAVEIEKIERNWAREKERADVADQPGAKVVEVPAGKGDNLTERALGQTVAEQCESQLNKENIVAWAGFKIATWLKGGTFNTNNIKHDWLRNVLDKCQLHSSEVMADIWSNIIAHEALKEKEEDGISRLTVNTMSMMDVGDINAFRRLLSFSIMMPKDTPVIFDYKDPYYQSNGVDFAFINRLESLNLVRRNERRYFVEGEKHIAEDRKLYDFDNHEAKIRYGGKCFILATNYLDRTQDGFEFGPVVLTTAGAELATVIGERYPPVEGFIERMHREYKGVTLVSEIMDEGDAIDFPRKGGFIRRSWLANRRLKNSRRRTRGK